MRCSVVLCFLSLNAAVQGMASIPPPNTSFGPAVAGSLMPGGSLLPPVVGASLAPTLDTPVVPEAVTLSLLKVDITAEELASQCDTTISKANSTYYSILSEPPTTLRDLLRVVNSGDLLFSNLQMLVGLFEEVHPSETVRDAASKCKLKATEVGASILLEPRLYKAARDLKDSPAHDLLDQRRYERLMKSFERSGVNLEDSAKRDRVKELTVEIETLSTEYSMNINKDTKFVSVAASDTAALEGLPADFIAAHTQDSMVKISTDYPDFRPTMKLAKSAELRRELYTAFAQRGAPANIEILEKVLAKRNEMATMLGYRSWAHYATEMMMIGDEIKAEEFMSGVVGITEESAARDLALMLAIKQEALPDASELQAYDASFYEQLALERHFAVNDTEVRAYFTYRAALEGILMTAGQLFGVTFVKASGATWHADVDLYDVYWTADTAQTTRIGRIYLDMFPRDNKYKHAAQFPMRSGVEGVQIPEGCLVCNFSPTGPMEFGDVRTLFHEFGHLMHHVVGGQEKRYIEFSGVATEWDFVEAPSQMLEEWVYDNTTLTRFAKHATTGEPIPNQLIDKLRRANLFGRGVHAKQQMFYGMLSLKLHTTPGVNSTEKLIELQKSYAPYPYVPNTFFHASFGHLMGYSSNYYTYMWSEAQALHMFEMFKSAPSLLDHSTALSYRENVIMPGGSKPAETLVYDFTHKSFNLDALNKHLQENPLA